MINFNELDSLFEMQEITQKLLPVNEYEHRTLTPRLPVKVLSFEPTVERDGIQYHWVFLEQDVTGLEDEYPLKKGCRFTSDLGYCFITDDGRSVIQFSDVLSEKEVRELI